MSRSKWKLTQEAEIDEWGQERFRFETRTVSVLKLLAENPQSELVEIHPGVYLGPKAP